MNAFSSNSRRTSLGNAFLMMSLLFGVGSKAFAGVSFSPEVNSTIFSFRALDEEDTANYFAAGAGIGVGYSLMRAVNFSLRGNYYPGRPKAPRVGKEDAALFSYGVGANFTLGGIIRIGVNGGKYIYNLVHQTVEDDVDGRWSGAGGGIEFGTMVSQRKSQAMFMSLAMESGVFEAVNPSITPSPTRRIDLVKLCFTFVYSASESEPMFEKTLKDFL